MDELLGRRVPWSAEAEQGVLGSCLIDPACLPDVMNAVRASDFYLDQNREIFETIFGMFTYAMPVDPITVLDQMKIRGVFHEDSSQQYIRELITTVIKAFNIATTDDLLQTEPYEGIADYFLFDTKGKLVGGNGEQFDWSVLTAYNGRTPFLLSGGIGPDDTERIRTFYHPRCVGIDLNSRFEVSPALKDVNQLRTFIKEIRI